MRGPLRAAHDDRSKPEGRRPWRARPAGRAALGHQPRTTGIGRHAAPGSPLAVDDL